MIARWRTILRASSPLVALAVAAPAALASAEPTPPMGLQNPLQAAEDCSMCHSFPNGPDTKEDPLVAPIAWKGTMMANAARDPVFWAGVAIAHQDHPDETIECVRCHSPRAFLGGRGDAIALAELDPDDRSGVDCVLCHRMIDDGVTPAGNARYVVDDVLGVDGKVPMRGPWTYPIGEEPMHSWAPGDLQAEARHCGTCHDVTTPRERVDADGQPLGVLFNEQRTYSEWLGSAYGPGGQDPKTCQACHMPAVADVAGCGKYASEGILHATGGRRHDLGGGNLFMIEVLRLLHGDGGTQEVADVFYEIAAANVQATLDDAALLEVTPPPTIDLAVGIPALPVKVTNQSGHKLPTGYSEGRVMWIEVVARHGDEVVYESGRWQGEAPDESDPQLRTYDAVAVDHGDQTTFHLLRNTQWLRDTRIPAKGMKKDLETDPIGDRYALLPDQTWPHWDEVTYAFGPATVVDATPGDPSDDVMELEVRLLYLVNTPAYLDFLVDENVTNAAGQAARDAYDAAGGPEPAVLASAAFTIPLTGLLQGGETTGSATDTSAGSTAGSTATTSAATDTSAGSTADTVSASGATTGPMMTGDGGCACTSVGASTGAPLLLVPLLALRRRRRRA